jgi:hypothetical protein
MRICSMRSVWESLLDGPLSWEVERDHPLHDERIFDPSRLVDASDQLLDWVHESQPLKNKGHVLYGRIPGG